MDKNKIIEAAAKLVAKGAYDKAIKEYQKVLDADPKDVRILQKMGELYQKKNDNVQAANYFRKVAESYSSDGFFLRAVALYKQVLKLDPSLMEVNVKLAELHQQLQLMGEAMAYFQIVANHYDKAGDVRRSLDVLKKMVDLDPDNVPSRVKLADLYVREGMNAEAIAEFEQAAEHLKRQNRVDDYLRVAERVSALAPDNLKLARELAEIYLQRNDQKRALAKLQVCFKANSRDVDTLRLLATAFQGLGQTSKTVSVYKELARAYEENGQRAEAEQVWKQVAALDPNDSEASSRTGLVRAINHGASGQAEAFVPPPPMGQAPPPPAAPAAAAAPPARPAAAAPPPPPQATDTGKAKGVPDIPKLLTETDVYVKYGLHDKALEHLRKIFTVEPENIDAHEKAYSIYVASNNHAQAFEQLLNVLRLHTRNGDVQRAQPFLQTMLEQQADHPEVPTFLSVLHVGEAAQQTEMPADVADEAILVDSSDDAVVVPDEPISAELAVVDDVDAADVVADEAVEVPPEATSDFDAPALEEGAAAYVEPPPVADDEPIVSEVPELEDPPTGQYAAMDEYSMDPHSVADEEEPRTDGMAMSAQAMFKQAGVPPQTQPQYPPVPPIPTRTTGTHKLDPSMLKTSVGYQSPARRRTEPEQPQATIDETVDSTAALDVPPVPTGRTTPAAEPIAEEPVEAPPAEEPASEECDEATFFLEQGLFEEAREILETILIAYPEHQRAAQLMQQLETAAAGGDTAAAGGDAAAGEFAQPDASAAPADENRDAFDLAQELANELTDEPSGVGAAPGEDEYQVSVEEVFSEFKKGLEKVVKPEDVETHYDLGIAYKEMGLVDDAVGEFTVARQGCVGKRKEIDCLSMIAMLQTMKGDHAAAIDAYLAALQSEHATGDVEKATRFELATVYEASGALGRALNQFMKVQAVDPSYRDVGQFVERLAAVAAPEEDAPPPPIGGGPGGGGPNGGGANGGGAPGGGASGGGPAGGGAKKKADGGSGTSRKVGYV